MTAPPPARRGHKDLVIAVVGAALMVATFFVVPAGSDPLADCRTRVDLEVSSSTEKSSLLSDMAVDYENAGRVVGGRCVDELTVHGLISGKAKIALAADWRLAGEDLPPRPQVWLPTSSMWLSLLEWETKGNSGAVADPPLGSVTASTLTIAMPRTVADTLERANASFDTWADVLELAQDPAGWAAYGREEWGDFELGRDNPEVSTSGLSATVATYHAAPGEVSARTLNSPEVVGFVHGIESSVGKYGDGAVRFMTRIFDMEQEGGGDRSYRPYVDAVVIQEQMVYAYNCGAPGGEPADLECGRKLSRPMTVVHPEDGTLKLDHPFITLAGASADQRAVAADFFAFLGEADQQERFRDFGFRDPNRPERPTEELAEVLDLPTDQRLTFVEPPPADLLATMLASWKNVKKQVRVLLVLDVSGSMRDVVNDPGRAKDPTKLALVKSAAKHAVDLLEDDDEIGVWTFSSGPYEVVHPIAPVGGAREEIKRRIATLHAEGETALYSTVEQAHDVMANLSTDRINAVVLLSDGENTVPYADDLISELDPAVRDISVRIFPIAYGNDNVPDDILEKIAQVTKGVKYEARNPLDIGRVFVDVFQNFG